MSLSRLFRSPLFLFRRSSHAVRIAGVLAAAALVGLTFTMLPTGVSARTVIGTAELKLASGEKVGTVRFENPKDGDATIVVAEFAFPANSIQPGTYHGMHIHANDSAANGGGCVADPNRASNTWFVAVDGHYKKDAAEIHGGHAGDLATVFINRDRTGRVETRIDRFVASELLDRAVVLHADPDNYGNIPKGTAANQYSPNNADAITLTNNTGNAGDRIACGVIDVK